MDAKKLQKETGFSGREIARILGQHETTVSRWLSGQRNSGKTIPAWPENLLLPIVRQAFHRRETLDGLLQELIRKSLADGQALR